jgi:hypothetical protein
MSMRPRGLLLNGNQFMLNGVIRDELDAGDAAALRQSGTNALLTDLKEPFSLWDLADRLGFLVLARVSSTDESLLSLAARELADRASQVGWLLPQELMRKKQAWQTALLLLQPAGRPFVGVELTRVPTGPLPAQVSFLLCEEALLPALEGIELAKLVLRREGSRNGEQEPLPSGPGILGAIHAE